VVTVLVPLAGEPGDVGVHLGLQRPGEHPPGALADDLIDQRRRAICRPVIASRRVRGYGEHRVCLPGPARQRWTLLENLYSVTGNVHPFPADPQFSSIARTLTRGTSSCCPRDRLDICRRMAGVTELTSASGGIQWPWVLRPWRALAGGDESPYTPGLSGGASF